MATASREGVVPDLILMGGCSCESASMAYCRRCMGWGSKDEQGVQLLPLPQMTQGWKEALRGR